MITFEVRVYRIDSLIFCQIKDFEPFEITSMDLAMLREFLFDLEMDSDE
jgi:hypothetical protein